MRSSKRCTRVVPSATARLVFSAQNTFDQAMFRGVRSATLDHGSLNAPAPRLHPSCPHPAESDYSASHALGAIWRIYDGDDLPYQRASAV